MTKIKHSDILFIKDILLQNVKAAEVFSDQLSLTALKLNFFGQYNYHYLQMSLPMSSCLYKNEYWIHYLDIINNCQCRR